MRRSAAGARRALLVLGGLALVGAASPSPVTSTTSTAAQSGDGSGITRVGTAYLRAGAHRNDVAPGAPLPRRRSAAQAPRVVQVSGPVAVCQTSSLGSPPVAVLGSVAAASRAGDVGRLGNDQALTPPDTQVAAGPVNVVEMVNAASVVIDRASGTQTYADLSTFFPLQPGFRFSDPRVVFDAQSGRWFASGFALDAGLTQSQVFLNVSNDADATHGWTQYVVKSTSQKVIADQPKLGMSSDKVVMSWDLGSASNVDSQEVDVIEKADLLNAAQTPHTTDFGRDFTRLHAIPAQGLSSGTTVYVVMNGLEPAPPGQSNGVVEVQAIDGLPSAGTVARTNTELAAGVAPGAEPPLASQPGTDVQLDTGDRRFMSAFWNSGVLFAAGDDGCTIGGKLHAGIRTIAISAQAGRRPSVLIDYDTAIAGASLMYPAPAPDDLGNVAVVATYCSSSTNPSLVVGGVVGSNPGAMSQFVTVATGGRNYTDSGGSPVRWGDYSGSAVDPLQPANLWLAGEVGDPSSSQSWATVVTDVSFNVPPPPPFLAGVAGSDGRLWVTDGTGQGFAPLGGVLTAAPAIAWVPAVGGGGAYVYVATGTDNQLWARTDGSGGWQHLSSAPSFCIDNPALVVAGAPGSTTLYAACQGSDHQLYIASSPVSPGVVPTTGGFGGYGGVLTAGPAATLVGNVPTFLVTGTDRHVYERTLSAGFVGMQWQCKGHPAAGFGGGISWFACHGTDDGLWYAPNTGGGWPSGAIPGGGVLVDGPGVAPMPNGQSAFFAEGSDQAVWELIGGPGGVTRGWTPQGGTARFGAGAV